MCLLAEFTDLWVIALRASVSCWLWAGGCPLFLVTLGSAHHSSLLHQSHQGKEFTSKIDITMWCNITRKWHSVAFFIFYFLEAIHTSCPHSKEEITQGCEYQEVGIIEVILGNVFKVQEVYKCALVYTFWICKIDQALQIQGSCPLHTHTSLWDLGVQTQQMFAQAACCTMSHKVLVSDPGVSCLLITIHEIGNLTCWFQAGWNLKCFTTLDSSDRKLHCICVFRAVT